MQQKSSLILSASSNLLGICFILLTSLKVFNMTEKTIVDGIVVVAILLFMSSCIMSFLALRSKTRRGEFYESIADYIFLSGLLLLFVTTLLFTFDIIA